jgi:ABC-type dipeptide/oligopeptide/nickel transport system permease subunit
MTEQSLERDRTAFAGAGAAIPADVGASTDPTLVHESGLDVEVRSQWTYARRRFMRHRLAVASLVILIVIFTAGFTAPWIAPYSFEGYDINNLEVGPTFSGGHVFGTDLLGRDYFSRVLYGIRTSIHVAFVVTILTVIIGTSIGMVAGYYSRWADNLLMRFTDLILTLPALAVLLTAAAFLGHGSQYRVAVIVSLLLWTLLARIVRGQFLSLREKEYIDAAKAAGSGDLRIMLRHMLPNALGPIVVFATLTLGGAILLESYLSYLGFGVQPPTPALGKLIADGQDVSSHDWWLVTFPGLTIVLIVLCINFVGDGLRDALDPTQRIRA